MADCPGYYTNISLILSRVMDDIGVNEKNVLKRRRANLMAENIDTVSSAMHTHKFTEYKYIFGSQTEGTTTYGLLSDIDILVSFEDTFNIIQDWEEWEHGKRNLIMVRDERLYPGHCKLLLLYADVPLPVRGQDCPADEKYCIGDDGNVVFKDHYIEKHLTETYRHGPAATQKYGNIDYDRVMAFPCLTWPKHYKQWTPDNKRRDWPTPEMIRHIKSTGCFVVKAAHRLDDRYETWRISTSLAERCLMFSLNITQIRCYVLLKMIVKTFIEPHLPETISSYMCKTLLFHCIENTRKEFWKEHNLLQCVHLVLLYMIAAVLDENCPNYFNESANLFLCKINGGKRNIFLSILRHLIRVRGRFLLSINFDNINVRMSTFLSRITNVVSYEYDVYINSKVFGGTMNLFVASICYFQHSIRKSLHPIDLFNIKNFIEKGEFQKKAARLMLPFFCSFLATVDASKSQLQNTPTKPLNLRLFDLSLNSDVTSSRLKFASYLYCTGQLERTLSVLQDVEERMTDSVMMLCGCHGDKYPPGFIEREASQKYPTTVRLALCVIFSMSESPCCPRELQLEMFRSTEPERRNRVVLHDDWMDLAVMDALPYLYYLQYMTYRHLGQSEQKYTALNKLINCVQTKEYIAHRETAFNVLGQCMEYEGWQDYAFVCYKKSLRCRSDNNAVRLHIMRLMHRWARGRL